MSAAEAADPATAGGGAPAHHARLQPDALREIADRAGTPAYVYEARALEAGARRWIRAAGDPGAIWYSVKANSNLSVLRLLARLEIGFEVATSGERARARRAGIPPERILMGGVPKSAAAVRGAIEDGVDLVVLQAEEEVEAAAGAADPDRPVRVGLRLRPGIRAGAHPALETGSARAKFGFSRAEIGEAWGRVAAASGLRPASLAVHLGSGVEGAEPYGAATEALLGAAKDAERTGPPVRELDLGGGLGVRYEREGGDPDPADVVRTVRDRLREAGGPDRGLRFEPGRSVCARAGLLLTRVRQRRERDGGPALVCDAGFTDFSRPVLYRAHHRILPLAGSEEGEATVDVLGPTCESGDALGLGRSLHGVEAGDLLTVRDVGAYGFVMASNYNSRPRPPEVLVEEDGWRVVREREGLTDLWRGEEGALEG